MDTHKNAFLTPKGREVMVRYVEGGLSKAAAARQFNITPKIVGKITADTGPVHEGLLCGRLGVAHTGDIIDIEVDPLLHHVAFSFRSHSAIGEQDDGCVSGARNYNPQSLEGTGNCSIGSRASR